MKKAAIAAAILTISFTAAKADTVTQVWSDSGYDYFQVASDTSGNWYYFPNNMPYSDSFLRKVEQAHVGNSQNFQFSHSGYSVTGVGIFGQ